MEDGTPSDFHVLHPTEAIATLDASKPWEMSDVDRCVRVWVRACVPHLQRSPENRRGFLGVGAADPDRFKVPCQLYVLLYWTTA